jgi:starch synthase (maltosyl-transferring)
MWVFWIAAWSDPWLTWSWAIDAKVGAGLAEERLAGDLEIGARLLERQAQRVPDRAGHSTLTSTAAALRDAGRPVTERVAVARSTAIDELFAADPICELVTMSGRHLVWVDRPRALHGAWYELFPRSTGGRDAAGRLVHGTLASTSADLPRIAEMGFDVIYLPPIHPIGQLRRKGPNNSPTASPEDVGSPWAVGSAEGGHDAVHPMLGEIDDFDALVSRAREVGLEVALDLALQCAPDHPWVAAHPEWFTVRPDGTIACAENPPKIYQDIYPLNFDNDREGLHRELLRVVTFWIEHGVRIFRVDNPHTKPLDFWYRFIWEIKKRYPETIFLAEAFTRPAMLKGLAKLGFTQSYTYFTWRNTKVELMDYLTELVDCQDFLRPNFFVNTPDILPAPLHLAPKNSFAIRAALAATLSPSWGMYSGFELMENVPLRGGSEEYLDSEKYQLQHRDYAAPRRTGRSLEPWIGLLNRIRRSHPAFLQLRTLRFHPIDSDDLIVFSKTDPAGGDTVVCVVTLDPAEPAKGTLHLDLSTLGLPPGERFKVVDEISGEVAVWGETSDVRVDPWQAVAQIWVPARP